jgi:hypothetical protein
MSRMSLCISWVPVSTSSDPPNNVLHEQPGIRHEACRGQPSRRMLGVSLA